MPSARYKNFKVTGVFKTGLYEYDSAYIYMGIENAQDLMGFGNKVTGLSIRVDDMWDVSRLKRS